MKSIGSMIVLLMIGSLANTAWSGAQNPAADSNQVATSKSPVLIEVEVRFVELSQEALDQLDVEWNLESKTETTNSHSSTLQDDRTDSNSAPIHISKLLTGSWNVFTALEVARIENIMGCNLLSAPKVTTRSGANAEIKVVREIRYPTAFDVQTVVLNKKSGQISLLATNEFISTSNRVMIAVSIPKKFETRETGVILNVTPTATADDKTISLTLNPQVVELVEWIDYGSMLRSVDGSSQQLKMLQPVFHSRNISSQIAIWDGQTVVMGGLTGFNDKADSGKTSWFVRWFGSKPERKTLLVMVTARRVNIAGKPMARSQP